MHPVSIRVVPRIMQGHSWTQGTVLPCILLTCQPTTVSTTAHVTDTTIWLNTNKITLACSRDLPTASFKQQQIENAATFRGNWRHYRGYFFRSRKGKRYFQIPLKLSAIQPGTMTSSSLWFSLQHSSTVHNDLLGYSLVYHTRTLRQVPNFCMVYNSYSL